MLMKAKKNSKKNGKLKISKIPNCTFVRTIRKKIQERFRLRFVRGVAF